MGYTSKQKQAMNFPPLTYWRFLTPNELREIGVEGNEVFKCIGPDERDAVKAYYKSVEYGKELLRSLRESAEETIKSINPDILKGPLSDSELLNFVPIDIVIKEVCTSNIKGEENNNVSDFNKVTKVKAHISQLKTIKEILEENPMFHEFTEDQLRDKLHKETAETNFLWVDESFLRSTSKEYDSVADSVRADIEYISR